MGRRVEERFDHGTYTAEFVKEMEPLGEDRKTIIIPDTAPEKLLDASAASLAIFLSRIMAAFGERWGEEAWKVAENALRGMGEARAARMAQRLKVDPNDARSIGRLFDFEDNGMGIKGEWVETGKKRAVKHELYCPLARFLQGQPEICMRLLGGPIQQATFETLGIRLKPAAMTKLLPLGDPYCEVIVELAD